MSACLIDHPPTLRSIDRRLSIHLPTAHAIRIIALAEALCTDVGAIVAAMVTAGRHRTPRWGTWHQRCDLSGTTLTMAWPASVCHSLVPAGDIDLARRIASWCRIDPGTDRERLVAPAYVGYHRMTPRLIEDDSVEVYPRAALTTLPGRDELSGRWHISLPNGDIHVGSDPTTIVQVRYGRPQTAIVPWSPSPPCRVLLAEQISAAIAAPLTVGPWTTCRQGYQCTLAAAGDDVAWQDALAAHLLGVNPGVPATLTRRWTACGPGALIAWCAHSSGSMLVAEAIHRADPQVR